MKRIQPYPVAVALSLIFFILYAVCIGLHLLFPDTHPPMYHLWNTILVGFTWITPLSFLLGSLDVLFGGFYVAYLLIPLYNYFNRRFPAQEGEDAMKPLRFKPVAFAVTSFGVITYVICILFDLIFPQWTMVRVWESLLPGFTGLDWGSFLIGLIGMAVYGFYTAAVFVPIYNFFQAEKLPQA